jgi:hypothetical protein
MRRMFGPKSAEITEGRRKLLNELHNFNCEENIIGIIKINCGEVDRACSVHGREVYIEFCYENQKERGRFEIPRRMWEDNIKIDL